MSLKSVAPNDGVHFLAASDGGWRFVALSLTGHVAQLAWVMERPSQLASISIPLLASNDTKWGQIPSPPNGSWG